MTSGPQNNTGSTQTEEVSEQPQQRTKPPAPVWQSAGGTRTVPQTHDNARA